MGSSLCRNVGWRVRYGRAIVHVVPQDMQEVLVYQPCGIYLIFSFFESIRLYISNFFLSLYVFSPKEAIGYEADIQYLIFLGGVGGSLCMRLFPEGLGDDPVPAPLKDWGYARNNTLYLIFFLSLHTFPPKGALGYEADISNLIHTGCVYYVVLEFVTQTCIRHACLKC